MDCRLRNIRIFVTDWERAVSFYSETLGIPVAFAEAETGWAELETGAARIALERADPNDEEAAELVGRFIGLSLEVDDVASIHQAWIGRGVEFVEPPERQPWGGILAHFRDPDANVLTLVES